MIRKPDAILCPTASPFACAALLFACAASLFTCIVLFPHLFL